MRDRVRRITVTDVGDHRRIVVDGQEYVLLHDAYEMAAAARAEEQQRIARWKDEAMIILREWEDVWTALGSPGRLGESKARATLAAITQAGLSKEGDR